MPTLMRPGFAQATAPNILMLYPYGMDTMPYEASAFAFKIALVNDLGSYVNFHEVSLDAEQLSNLPMQAALAEFLQKRFATNHPDLIVALGAPAAQFMEQYRDVAFAGLPALFLGADPRLWDYESSYKDATLVRQDIKPAAWIEDILQMAPDTSNIVFPIGSSPLERAWAEVYRRELQIYSDKVNIAYLEDMPLDQIEKRISALPAHSFVLFTMFIRDTTGITYNGNEAIQRLHAAANAPIYGIFQSQMGSGIIGGRLYEDQTVGIQGAHSAARILRGEPAESIQQQLLPTPSPVYDWRELQRLGIKESRLPPGSSILLREPTLWQRYRWYIAGLGLFAFIGTLLIIGLVINLLRRRSAERSLRHREKLYHGIFRAESDALFLFDYETGRILDANPAAEKMYRYSREELLRLGSSDISAEPEKSETARQAGITHIPLHWHRRKDGSIFPVEVSAGRIDEPGITHAVVVMRDIHERLNAQEKLRLSEQKYRRLHESMMDAFVSVDMSGRIQEFNPAYRQLLGYSDDELRRLTYQELTPERWHAFEDRVVRDQVLKLGYSDVYEKEYRRKDETVVPVELRTFLLKDERGEPEGMWAIVRDITERKRASETLLATEKRFRQVAESVSDFIWEVDANGLYTYTSPSVERILGYAPGELMGKMHFYDLFVPNEREELKDLAFQVFAKRERFQAFQNTNVSRSGKIVYLETSGRPVLDETGRLLGYRGADTDVTERREAEIETQNLRLELGLFSRAAMVSELAASIAHEFNQPLTAILSNAQAALRLMEDGSLDVKELQEILGDIAADDQRAAEVIRSMRSMLKRSTADHQPLLLNDLVRNVLALVRNEALLRRILIFLDLGLPLAPVQGDRVQLQQVVLNLVMNAFDALETSSHPRKLILRTHAADGEAVLDVVDSGPGIVADKPDSIFEPFYTTKPSGLGMGLSLSRSIVIAHNGRLWAENNPDGGATLHLALPLRLDRHESMRRHQ